MLKFSQGFKEGASPHASLPHLPPQLLMVKVNLPQQLPVLLLHQPQLHILLAQPLILCRHLPRSTPLPRALSLCVGP